MVFRVSRHLPPVHGFVEARQAHPAFVVERLGDDALPILRNSSIQTTVLIAAKRRSKLD